ncbi:MAG TPA: YIP1 family protein [Gaiellaceae bacterium]
MGIEARGELARTDERFWLGQAVAVLVSPRPVFASLRDDSDAAARARGEAVLALVLLTGIATVLWAPNVGRLMDDRFVQWDALLIAIVVFIGGSIYGAVGYWVFGFVLYAAVSPFRVTRSYRQARHVLAFASAPVALSLFLLWPVRLAVYGDDVFKSGGSDHGAGNYAFVGLELLFVAWALGLLVLGLREVRSKASSSSLGIS